MLMRVMKKCDNNDDKNSRSISTIISIGMSNVMVPFNSHFFNSKHNKGELLINTTKLYK